VSRPHSGHRSHRRRWSSGSGRRPVADVNTLIVTPLPDCRDGWECCWHGECSSCGDTIHLVELDSDWAMDAEAMARFICGTPPLCHHCRGAG
jgi:hypothetical protein